MARLVSVFFLPVVFFVAASSSLDLSTIAYPLDPYDEQLQAVLDQSPCQIADALAFIDRAENPCNWIAEYPIVASLIMQFNLKVGVEIGVAFGGQSEYLLANTSIEKLFSIDPYQHFSTGYVDTMNFNQAIFDVLHIKTAKRLEPYKSRSVLLRELSQNASQIFFDRSLDFVYIDGNHSYEAVKQDIESWYPKIRSGGLLIGDDYSVYFLGLCQAVNEFCQKEGLKLYNLGAKWWVLKP